jgi:thymidine kinase
MNNTGKLNLIVGCMFAGKTSEIVIECRRRLKINQKVLGITYSDDNRYTDESYIVNHNLEKIKSIKVKTLSEVNITDILNNDFIFIDEGQFFSDLTENVLTWVNKYKKSVYIYGLDGDFKRQSFGRIHELLPHCDNITKLKALCTMCNDGTEALFTHRISKENTQVVIGVDNYVPLCREHYNQLNDINNVEDDETY